jgi:xanthine dehydrogenase accessory factor
MRKNAPPKSASVPGPEASQAPVSPDVPPRADQDSLEARLAWLLETGIPTVLLTVISRQGSTPSHAGAHALLTPAGLEGTLGGGALEARAVEAARLSLESGISTRVLCESAHLSPASDMACNDSMNVLCEALTPEQARLLAELEQTGKLHAALVFRAARACRNAVCIWRTGRKTLPDWRTPPP